MGQDVITCLALCSFAPHSQVAVEAIPICAFLSEIDQYRFEKSLARRATLMLDWARLFSSSNAAGTNGCLNLSFSQLSTKRRQELFI